MPIDYSICLHATEMDFPLVVDDAHSHPLLRNNRMVAEYSVAAYLGAPIHLPGSGKAAGTICAMHRKPRRWSAEETRRVIDAAQVIDGLLGQRGRPH